MWGVLVLWVFGCCALLVMGQVSRGLAARRPSSPAPLQLPRCLLGCLCQRGSFYWEQGKQLQGPGRAPAVHAGKPLAARDNHRHPGSEIPLRLRDQGRPAGVDHDFSESYKPADAASGIRRCVCGQGGGRHGRGAGGAAASPPPVRRSCGVRAAVRVSVTHL